MIPKLHYTTRNKYLTRYKLWSFAHFFAKRRFIQNPHDSKAAKWLKITETNAQLQTLQLIKSEEHDIDEKTLNNFAELYLSEESGEHVILTLDKIAYTLRNNEQGLIFLKKLLKRAEKNKTTGKAKQAYIKHLLHKIYEQDNLSAAAQLKNTVNNLNNKALKSWCTPIEFFKVRHETLIPVNNQKDTLKKQQKKDKVILIADTLDIAMNAIPSLPNNMALSCYVLEKINDQKLDFKELNITLNIQTLSNALTPFNSDPDLEAITMANEFGTNLAQMALAELDLMGSYPYRDILAEPLGLQTGDNLLKTFRELVAVRNLHKKANEIYIVFDKRNAAQNIAQYLMLRAENNNDLNIYLGKSKHEFDSKHGKNKRWLAKNILISSNQNTKTPFIISQKEAKTGFKTFKNSLLKTGNNWHIKAPYVASYLNTTDPNYKRATKIIARKITEQKQNFLLLSHQRNPKFLHQFLNKRDMFSMHRRLKIIDASNQTFRTDLATRKNAWISYLCNALINTSRKSGLTAFDDIDLGPILEPQIRRCVTNTLAPLMIAAQKMDQTFSQQKPDYVITAPGRHMIAWLMIAIAKKYNVPTFDLQILMQTSYPRYKPSKADIFGMMNQEQLQTYKKTFDIPQSQKIVKVGSLLFNETVKRYKQLDEADIRGKQEISQARKVILFATQYLNTADCRDALNAILPQLKKRKNTLFIIKTHPKERDQDIDAYRKLIKKHKIKESAARIVLDQDIYELIKISDLVITLFSNVGMEAALFDKDVWSVNTNRATYPCDITIEGLVEKVHGTKTLQRYIEDWFGPQKYATKMQEKRKKFFAKNPEQRGENVFESLLEFHPTINRNKKDKAA